MSRKRKTLLDATPLEDRLTPAGLPILDAWLKASPGEYALVVSGSNVAAGPQPTWNTPVANGTAGTNTVATVADVQSVKYSATTVYVTGPDFSSSVMGPWYNPNGQAFQNFPSNQNRISRFTRTPVAAANGAHVIAPNQVGVAVNGVSLFNMSDAQSYSTTTGTVSFTGSGYWNRDAFAGEAATFDHAHAHQPQSGEYHYHISPTALRAQLRDNIGAHVSATNFPNDPNVVFTASSGSGHNYDEYTAERHHSPILGFAFDGFPIYGPYGYADGTNAASAIVQNTSSFRLRNITVRQTLPGFAAKAKFGDTVALNGAGEYGLTATQYGPAVSATWPLGTFIEDYEYVSGLGTLDLYNGRFTKTPEYPNGTFAYFVSIDAEDGDDVFPYVTGRQFHGVMNGGKATSITEAVTDHFNITAPQAGGSVRGVVYFDTNGDGKRGDTELGTSGITAFLDANGNNTLDSGETSATTSSDGGYELAATASGAKSVRVVVPTGFTQTSTQPAAVTVAGGNAIFGVTLGLRVLPPTVTTSQVNDGTAQRSRVTSAAVTFSEAVTFPNGIANAFTVQRTSGGGAGTVAFTAVQSGSVVTLTFANGGTIGLEANGSIPDGRYTITAVAANISGSGGLLDGNGNGTGGDNGSVTFHRLFGDGDGNATVNTADLTAFGNAFNTAGSAFDSDANSVVDIADLTAFGNRFNVTL